MEITLIIAKVLGLYFVVSGVFIVTHKKTFMLIIKDIFEHKAISFLVGILLVFGGGFLVLRGNTGSDPLSLFVWIASWAILLKGIAYLFFPEWLKAFAVKIPKSLFPLLGTLLTVFGIYLLFFLA